MAAHDSESPVSAGLSLAARGWPVLWLKPQSKLPATPHGVKDATCDPDTIRGWAERMADGNIGVATGLPGPTVLDIDDMAAGAELAARATALGAPVVATARGQQFYFQGTDSGTIGLGYGELRGRGSYVVCPPSIHPTGKAYVWLLEPNGRLPTVPDVGKRTTAGAGAAPAVEHVAPGDMYQYLLDLAVRLARAGEQDVDVIERALLAAFELKRIPGKTYGGDAHDTRRLAEFAANSEIAGRERARAGSRFSRRANRPAQDDTSALEQLTELLCLDDAGVKVTGAAVYGRGSDARAVIQLSNGDALEFESLRSMARPQTLLAELAAVASVVPDLKQPACMHAIALVSEISDKNMRISEVDLARDWGMDYLQDASVVDVDTRDQAQRWGAFSMLANRDPDITARQDATSLAKAGLVLRDWDGARLVRSGWFLGYVRSVAPRVSHIALPSLMAQAGWESPKQIKATQPAGSKTLHWKFYVAPADWENLDDAD
jgi:hypothetical protein